MTSVVNQAERRHRPRRDPEMSHQPVWRAEAQTIVADDLDERPQVRTLRNLEDNEIVAIALLVAQEKILDLRCVDAGPVRLHVLGVEDRRMREPLVRDAERIESGIHWHGGIGIRGSWFWMHGSGFGCKVLKLRADSASPRHRSGHDQAHQPIRRRLPLRPRGPRQSDTKGVGGALRRPPHGCRIDRTRRWRRRG